MGRRPKLAHPGTFIGNALASQGVTQADLSRRTGYSRKHINLVVNGKANLSPACAVAIGTALEIDPRLLVEASVAWLYRVADDEIRVARRVA
jgi:plasmid maintenance system antidote protein VapI